MLSLNLLTEKVRDLVIWQEGHGLEITANNELLIEAL